MMFYIILIHDNNMEIKTNSLRWKPVHFYDLCFAKGIQTSKVGGWVKDTRECASFMQRNQQLSFYAFRWRAMFLLSVSTIVSGTLLPVICMQHVVWHFGLPAYISQRKKKELMLPACPQLAKTHHVHFMTTARYCCQFFHSDSDSLGHPRKLTAFIFYGAAFVSFWQCQWKIQGDALSYGSSPLMRPQQHQGDGGRQGCRLTNRQTTVAAKIAAREVLMVCCQGDKDQPAFISFADEKGASELLLMLA